ncbi:hypothetical protein [Nesterenkonia sp. Act20]|uniref:hypothetical protein n=1 Tax=Nesterenkonia sp. Act20 TaxID=1483432 RepID=UPI00210031B8|nr:hypothetical protein [Nesterenkonia sp. Act20]
MNDGGRDARNRTIQAGVVGFIVMAGYAVVGALQILVWNPLAAVPGATLSEINSELAQANETLAAPLVMAWAVIGVLLAAAVLLAALLGSIPRVRVVVTMNVLILVLAVPAHWIASFPAGMGIADTFATTGADHAPWGMVLYALSAAALVVLFVILLVDGLTGKIGRQNTGE